MRENSNSLAEVPAAVARFRRPSGALILFLRKFPGFRPPPRRTLSWAILAASLRDAFAAARSLSFSFLMQTLKPHSSV